MTWVPHPSIPPIEGWEATNLHGASARLPYIKCAWPTLPQPLERVPHPSIPPIEGWEATNPHGASARLPHSKWHPNHPSRFRVCAISYAAPIRIIVSIFTPNAFSIRSRHSLLDICTISYKYLNMYVFVHAINAKDGLSSSSTDAFPS